MARVSKIKQIATAVNVRPEVVESLSGRMTNDQEALAKKLYQAGATMLEAVAWSEAMIANTYGSEGEADDESDADSDLAAALAGDELVESRSNTQAPPDTTAVKRPMQLKSSFARQLGLKPVRYLGCSFCRNDLEEFADEQGVPVEAMEFCPFCGAIFVPEEETYCYACSTKLPDSGVCVKCRATINDDEETMIMVIAARMEGAAPGSKAKREARDMMEDRADVIKTVRTARAQNWVNHVQRTGQLPGRRGFQPEEDPSQGRFPYSPPRNRFS